ncbi:NnrU family protein [Pyruvatibacter mobilis]|uniref:NnrU family protein n=1 Tax=Pyruvatibacter mobilis TaxID=1712261 RepID=UPI003BAD7383
MIADPTLNLAAAAACFLGIHIFISGTRLRDGLVRMIGEGPYMGLFSLLSLGAIVWLAMAFNRASEETFTFLWAPAPWWHHFAMTAILVAAILVVLGNVTKSPTAAGGDSALEGGDGNDDGREAGDAARGILRITRHPFLWGVLLWALAHVAMNGDLSSLIFFGAFAVLAFIGPMLIDAKRARKLGDRWDAFAARTSNLPFAAILTGRNKLRLGEIGILWPLVGVGLYLALAFGHEWLFGVSALPVR